MSHLVAGDPSVFPENITVPDNSDPRDASSVVVPLGGVIDRTAWLRDYARKGLPPFSHWATVDNTSNVDVVKFNQATRDWYGMSTTVADKFQRTKDYTAWPGTTEISGGGLVMTPVVPGDVEFNSAGHGIIMGNTIDIYAEYNGTTWTRHIGEFGADPTGTPRGVTVKFSPTSGRWAISFSLGVGIPPRVYYGTDRATWTGVDLPFPNDTEVKIGSNGANTLVAIGREGTNIHFSRSIDGGATWSAVQTIAAGLAMYTGVAQIEPIWTGTKWFAVAFSTTTSKVYSSADGLTFGLAKAFTATPLQSLCSIGPMLVGGATNGDMIVSFDDGTSWLYCDRRFPSASLNNLLFTGSRLIASGGALLIVADGFGPTTAVVA